MNDYQLKKCLKQTESSQNVFVYIAKKDEPNTDKFIDSLLSAGKTVIVPKLGKEIVPVVFNSDLKPGKFDVLEPQNAEIFDKDKINIFFVPGTKFDRVGNRTGRGKGYFDRFLAGVSATKIGVCFETQIVDKINPNSWDIPVDIVITEKRTIKV